jgi:hypothetical protein
MTAGGLAANDSGAVSLDSYPFTKLRLAAGEVARWKAHNPTFHRGTSYGIVLSERALYLYNPLCLSFARWRRIPLDDVRGIEFKDSRFFPRLIVRTSGGHHVLRTPWDDGTEMDYDREKLRNAVFSVSTLLASSARHEAP